MLIIIISRSSLKLDHVGSKTRLLVHQATQVSDLGPLWPSCLFLIKLITVHILKYRRVLKFVKSGEVLCHRIIYDSSRDKDKPAPAESKLNLRMRT